MRPRIATILKPFKHAARLPLRRTALGSLLGGLSDLSRWGVSDQTLTDSAPHSGPRGRGATEWQRAWALFSDHAAPAAASGIFAELPPAAMPRPPLTTRPRRRRPEALPVPFQPPSLHGKGSASAR
jgi:hypothetical protein